MYEKKKKKILKRKYYDDDDELEIKYLHSKPQIEARYFRNLANLLFRGLIKVNEEEFIILCSFQSQGVTVRYDKFR